MSIKAISQPRFDALCFMRHPNIKITGEEREWYSDEYENVLGVLIFDKPDRDWLFIVLVRDQVARFRCVECEINKTDADAREALHQKMEKFSQSGESAFPQGIRRKNQKTFSIFTPTTHRKLLDECFLMLSESKGYSPAREIIKEIAYTFEDPDGNYIQQFQTTGFDARLWELYLYAVLHEVGFHIDRTYKSPDYVCAGRGGNLIIEATMANTKQWEKSVEISKLMERELKDFVAITLGSSLYSKLQKRYWEQRHVKGHPFVLAIADFRRTGDLGYCAPLLMEYLFGLQQDQKDGMFTVTPIKEHTFCGKTIPSGFFNLPQVEHISAILFSDSGTISKFNRMGKIAGFGDPNVTMAREGERFPSRDSTSPEPFHTLIDESYRENWAEGIWLFHNPNAQVPLERELFPAAAHVYLESGGFNVYLSEVFPTWSKTLIFTSERDEADTATGGHLSV
jgi:hypothetical protein